MGAVGRPALLKVDTISGLASIDVRIVLTELFASTELAVFWRAYCCVIVYWTCFKRLGILLGLAVTYSPTT